MKSIIGRMRTPGLKIVSALFLSLAILLVAQVAPASAMERRSQGGYGESTVMCYRNTRKIEVRAHVYQDNGGPQTLASGVQLYDNGKKMWSSVLDWKSTTTMVDGTTTSHLVYHTLYAPPGSHFVRVWYAWYTNSGWQYDYDNKGWCNF